VKSNQSKWWQTIIRFVAWMVSSILAIVDVLELRNAVTSIMVWNQIRIEDAMQGLDLETTQRAFSGDAVVQWSTLVFGLLAVAGVVWVEHYFRKGAAIGKLFQRIAIVIGAEVGVLVLAVVLQIIFT
jgi:hypothetical protein